jgi:hypothetical protein
MSETNPRPVEPKADEILADSWKRFFPHWGAATIGYFLRSLLPILIKWTDMSVEIKYPRWWVVLVIAAIVSALAGGINSNLPAKPREILKSIAIGFAIDINTLLAKLVEPAAHN